MDPKFIPGMAVTLKKFIYENKIFVSNNQIDTNVFVQIMKLVAKIILLGINMIGFYSTMQKLEILCFWPHNL